MTSPPTANQAPVLLNAVLAATGLTANARYVLLRYDSPAAVPSHELIRSGGFVEKTEFTATGDRHSWPVMFMSNSTTLFRCVAAAAAMHTSPVDTAPGCDGPAVGDAVQLGRCSDLPPHQQRRSVWQRLDGSLALEAAGGEPALCLERSGATPPCGTDHDCQLNGQCVRGRCECDAAWRGNRCEELALEGDGAFAYGGPVTRPGSVTSWGAGPPALDPATGNWTLFVTEIAGHCGLSEWGQQSTVVAATASSPAGPFERQRVAIDYQAHNPYYAYDASTKTHVIFHIGDGVNHNGPEGPRQCTNGTTPPGYSHSLPDRLRGLGADASAGPCPCACGPCGSWVHHAASLDGPFERLAVPFNTINKTTEGEGFVMDNPAPYIFPNGTTLVLFRKLNFCAMQNPPTCKQTRALTEIWLVRSPQALLHSHRLVHLIS
jgi:hypothetical protein